MARWIPPPLATCVQSDGEVAAGYYYKFFEPDDAYSTEKTVYKNAAKTSSWTQPVGPLTAAGLPSGADIYLDGLYDCRVYDGDPDSGGNLVRSILRIGDNRSAVATDLENLIQNGSAETDDDADSQPDGWTKTENGDTLVRDITEQGHGVASFKITGNNGGKYTSAVFEVSDLYTYNLSYITKASNADADTEVQIEWLDEDQSTLSTDTGDSIASGSMPTSFTLYSDNELTPAAGARFAKLHLIGNTAGSSRDVWFDDVIVNQKTTTVKSTSVAAERATDLDLATVDMSGYSKYILPVDISSGSVTITLPAAADYDDIDIEIFVSSDAGTSSTNKLTIETSASSAVHYGWQAGDGAKCTSDGTNEWVRDKRKTLAFSVELASDQSLTQSTWELVAWDTELYDIGGLHSAGTFTVPTGGDGVWQFIWSMEMSGLADGNGCDYAIYVDGSVYKWITDTEAAENSADEIQGGSIELALTATQTVKLYAFTEGTGDVINADFASFFSGRWVRET